MKMLLFSNSGKPLYHWCKQIIADFFKDKFVYFISAASAFDESQYFASASQVLKPLGVKLNHLLFDKISADDLDKIDAFLVGGGNTYRLLLEVKKYKLAEKIRSRVWGGALYVGLSAGANITGSDILTTNDWNILGSTDFEGLKLVPFNINPHYGAPQDRILTSAESRDDRIKEYHQFHNNPVVALEEETYLEANDKHFRVGNSSKGIVKVFLRNKEPEIYKAGELISIK